MFVIILNRETFDAMSAEQQGWVRGAAADAVRASVEHDYDEAEATTVLCGQGVQLTAATVEQLAELRTKARPVYEALAADPVTADGLALVEHAVQSRSAVDALRIPVGCARR